MAALVVRALATTIMIAFAFHAGYAQASRCEDARLMINGFFEQLPPQVFLCDDSADCKPYYLRGDDCAPPVILGILGDRLVADNSGKLVPLQAAVRRFCPQPEMVCAPVVVPFACVDNRCVEIDLANPPKQAVPDGTQGHGVQPTVPNQPVDEPGQTESLPPEPEPSPAP